MCFPMSEKENPEAHSFSEYHPVKGRGVPSHRRERDPVEEQKEHASHFLDGVPVLKRQD